ncbi:MAG TPA: DUF1365 domain-containing protein [Acidimicrobiia bacterium]|nr:DUF1365 domain-containing protein [Acidimicrobiia bacterium]
MTTHQLEVTHRRIVTPAVFRTTIHHVRHAPVHHEFSYRQPMWLVDVDALPQVARPFDLLLRFDARDHLGDPLATIRANVDAHLADAGIERPARVLMLANPRSLGHGFNPITVFWCSDRDGVLVAVVAEVHNTYGGRHCYLVQPERLGQDAVDGALDKELYVSPFFPVDGRYDMRVAEPRDGLDVAIALRRDGAVVFEASLRAEAATAVRRPLVTALRHPASSWWVTARIRVQGIRLWRRLPIVPRPVRT